MYKSNSHYSLDILSSTFSIIILSLVLRRKILQQLINKYNHYYSRIVSNKTTIFVSILSQMYKIF